MLPGMVAFFFFFFFLEPLASSCSQVDSNSFTLCILSEAQVPLDYATFISFELLSSSGTYEDLLNDMH